MNGTRQKSYTVWVCTDCYFTHHYGTPSDDPDYVPDRTPLALLGDSDVSAGLIAEEHDPDCPVWLGDPNRPDVPTGEKCECEHRTFSWSICDGCGSALGGAREALTVWED